MRSPSALLLLTALLALSSSAINAQDSRGPPKVGESLVPFDELVAEKPDEELIKNAEQQTLERVKLAKAELEEALKDIDTAWRKYVDKFALGEKMAADPRRQDIFKRNLVEAATKNDENFDPYLAYGITQFSHLTPSEFASTILMDPATLGDPTQGITGRKLLQGSVPCGTNTAFPGWGAALPSYWDWRNAGVITPVKNQGGCGSCSDFSTLSTLESTWIRKWWGLGYRNYNTDLSEDDWLECTAGDQCKGAWPDSVFDRFICRGAPFETADPYDANDSNTCRAIPRYNTGAVGFAYIDKDPTSLAKAVRRNPTVIAVDASNWHGLAAGWVRNCGEPYSKLNHAVAVVGWVDNVPMSNGQTWDFWYVRNSWGTGFVNDGYIWIRKDCSTSGGRVGPYGMYKTKSWTPVM